jgi:hypothetical protein
MADETLGPPAFPESDNKAWDAAVPYIRRKIDVTFSIGTGDFGEQGKNVVTLRGYRVQATITKGAVGAQTVLNLRIWGMRLSQMQQVLTYGQKFTKTRDNRVIIEVGDEIAGMTQVFYGNIYDAYFDGTAQPDVALQVTAYEGYLEAIKPAPPISVNGTADVAQMMRQLADQTGARFEDSGVRAKLRDVYYPGTAYQQMRRIAEHSGINFTLENNVLAIWNKSGSRAAGDVPLFTPKNGMKDYPTFNQQGVIVTCLFRKAVLGGQVVGVKSQLFNGNEKDPDSGDIFYYKVYTYTYTLESEMPNGPWFTTFMATAQPP